jgi:hypothetical protein
MRLLSMLTCLIIGLPEAIGARVPLVTEFRVVRDDVTDGFSKLFVQTPTGLRVPVNVKEDDPNFARLLKTRSFVKGTIVLSLADADFTPYWLEHERQIDNLRKEFGKVLSVKTPFWIPPKGTSLTCIVVTRIDVNTATYKLTGALEEWAKVTYR